MMPEHETKHETAIEAVVSENGDCQTTKPLNLGRFLGSYRESEGAMAVLYLSQTYWVRATSFDRASLGNHSRNG